MTPSLAQKSAASQRLRENAKERQCDDFAGLAHDLRSLANAISHDLRAPLRAIDGFSRILEEDFTDKLGDEGRHIISVIRAGSQTMDRLVSGLGDFLRVSAAVEPLDLDVVDMAALAVAATHEIASVQQGAAVPHIEIAELPKVAGDITSLRQVWSNLIGNAVKFSAKRVHPHIAVSGCIQNGEAVYQVQDNGAGFDMRYADRLFGVFQRLHNAQDFVGAGVGLAIVRRIVARHGGRVWAEGAPDAGACFQFALPVPAPSG